MRARVRRLSALASSVLALAAVHCGGGGGGGGSAAASPVAPAPNWLVMVYMAADNNLESLAPATIDAMAAATSSPNVKVLVQVETKSVPVNGSTTAKRIEIGAGTKKTVDDLGEIDTASAGAVADFVQWAVSAYTADRRVLIFWDHGGQWTGWGVDDTGAGSSLAYSGLKSMFAAVKSASGIAKFDLVGFDSCLMAGLEIDLLLSNYAKYRVASCEVEAGEVGQSSFWDYTYWLSTLAVNPRMSVQNVGQQICDGFIAQKNRLGFFNQTLSVANLANTASVVASLDTLATKLQGALPADVYAIAKARRLAPEYGDVSPSLAGTLVDLRAFASNVSTWATDATVRSAASSAVNAIDSEIVYRVQGSLETSHGGASIYCPISGGLDSTYTSTVDLAQSPHKWVDFVTTYQNAIASDVAAPLVTIDSPAAGSSIPVNGTFTVDGNDVATDIFDVGAWFTTQIGPTTWFLQGDEDAGNLAAGTYNYGWDGRSFVVWDGSAPYADWLCALSPHVTGNLYFAKMQYVGAASGTPIDVIVYVKLDWKSGSGSIQGVYYVSPSGVQVALPVVPGDSLTPYYTFFDLSTPGSIAYLLSGTTLTVPTKGLSGFQIYELSLGSGPHDLFVFAQDYAGNIDGDIRTFDNP